MEEKNVKICDLSQENTKRLSEVKQYHKHFKLISTITNYCLYS